MAEVLVVDDALMYRELLEMALARLGHTVRLADNGDAALREIGRQLPDVLLLDMCMPGLSGVGVLQRLRAERRFVDLPVIMLTSSSDRDDVMSCRRLGVSGYVLKTDLKLAHLASRISEAVSSEHDAFKPSEAA